MVDPAMVDPGLRLRAWPVSARAGYVYLHSIVDGFSRLAYTEELADEKATTTIGFFHRARAFFAAHGIHRFVRVVTDNGPNSTARAFVRTVLAVASRHQRIRPHTPRHNGKVERYHRILAEELLYARIWTSEAERAAAIDVWNIHYNYHRAHTAAGDQPPASRLSAGVTNVMAQNTQSAEGVAAALRAGVDTIEHGHLQVGDVLLMRGAWDALERKAGHSGVLSVDDPDLIRRQSVRLGVRSYVAVGVLVLMCIVLALELLPPAIVVMIAAVVLVVSRVLSFPQAQRAISLTTIVVVAGMIPLSTAIQTSGAADLISDSLVAAFGESSPRLLLVCIVLIVMVLGQFLSNLATVLIVAPVAVAVAGDAGVSPLPMMMGITIAGAASFLTPVATPGNLMVQDPGAYRFGDYWKLGLVCMALYFIIATVLVPIVWPF